MSVRERVRRAVHVGDRAAALVETAIVVPLLVLLLLGVVDFSLLYRHGLSLSTALRVSARTGVAAGTDPEADWRILSSLLSASDTIDPNRYEVIMIFKATDANGDPSTACNIKFNRTSTENGVGGQCNIYRAPFPASAADDAFKALQWTTADRDASTSDYLGVAAITRFSYATGMFGRERTVKDRYVMRLEPEGSDPPSASPTTGVGPTTTRPGSTTTVPGVTTTINVGPTTTGAGATTTTRPASTTTAPGATTTTRVSSTTTTVRPTSTTGSVTSTTGGTTTTRVGGTTTTVRATTTTARATTTTGPSLPTTTTTRPPTTTTTVPKTTTTNNGVF